MLWGDIDNNIDVWVNTDEDDLCDNDTVAVNKYDVTGNIHRVNINIGSTHGVDVG